MKKQVQAWLKLSGSPSKEDAEKSLIIANNIYKFCEDLLSEQ